MQPMEDHVRLLASERQKLAEAGEDKFAAVMEELMGKSHFSCIKGVWDAELVNPPIAANVRQVIRADRGDLCFFLQQQPEPMALEAAEELERRSADRREAENDRKLTRRALKYMFGALLVSVAALLLNWGCDVVSYLRTRRSDTPAVPVKQEPSAPTRERALSPDTNVPDAAITHEAPPAELDLPVDPQTPPTDGQ